MNMKNFREFLQPLLSQEESDNLNKIIKEHYPNFRLNNSDDSIELISIENIDWMSGNWGKVSTQIDKIKRIKIGTNYESSRKYLLRKVKFKKILN